MAASSSKKKLRATAVSTRDVAGYQPTSSRAYRPMDDDGDDIYFRSTVFFEQLLFQTFQPLSIPFVYLKYSTAAIFNMQLIPPKTKDVGAHIAFFIFTLMGCLPIPMFAIWALMHNDDDSSSSGGGGGAPSAEEISKRATNRATFQTDAFLCLFCFLFHRVVVAIKYAYMPHQLYSLLMHQEVSLKELRDEQLASGWMPGLIKIIRNEVRVQAAMHGEYEQQQGAENAAAAAAASNNELEEGGGAGGTKPSSTSTTTKSDPSKTVQFILTRGQLVRLRDAFCMAAKQVLPNPDDIEVEEGEGEEEEDDDDGLLQNDDDDDDDDDDYDDKVIQQQEQAEARATKGSKTTPSTTSATSTTTPPESAQRRRRRRKVFVRTTRVDTPCGLQETISYPISPVDMATALIVQSRYVNRTRITRLSRFAHIFGWFCAFLPSLLRLSFGLPIAGTTRAEMFVMVSSFVCNFLFAPLTFFFMSAGAVDHMRRWKALELLGRLIAPPIKGMKKSLVRTSPVVATTPIATSMSTTMTMKTNGALSPGIVADTSSNNTNNGKILFSPFLSRRYVATPIVSTEEEEGEEDENRNNGNSSSSSSTNKTVTVADPQAVRDSTSSSSSSSSSWIAKQSATVVPLNNSNDPEEKQDFEKIKTKTNNNNSKNDDDDDDATTFDLQRSEIQKPFTLTKQQPPRMHCVLEALPAQVEQEQPFVTLDSIPQTRAWLLTRHYLLHFGQRFHLRVVAVVSTGVVIFTIIAALFLVRLLGVKSSDKDAIVINGVFFHAVTIPAFTMCFLALWNAARVNAAATKHAALLVRERMAALFAAAAFSSSAAASSSDVLLGGLGGSSSSSSSSSSMLTAAASAATGIGIGPHHQLAALMEAVERAVLAEAAEQPVRILGIEASPGLTQSMLGGWVSLETAALTMIISKYQD